MSPIFFSKKIPSVQKVLLYQSNLNFESVIQSSSKGLNLRKRGNLQKKFQNSNRVNLSFHFKQALVVCDKRFQFSSLLKKWRTNSKFQFYYIKSGEKTKSLEQLPHHIQKINSLISDFDRSSFLFIAVGGGSVIDLTGFLASIYKRGLPVIFIPSTWLSALDSAHGGKNALNFKNVKNLLGTYYFPQAVFMVEELLKHSPKKIEQQAYGELLKMAFIKGGSFYNSLKQDIFKNQKISIQKFIQPAIESKIKIVQKDPFETKGERKKLNLGHTVGHILEAVEALPHGLAVLHGLLFSLNWSYYKGFLSKKRFEEMKGLISLKERKKKIPLNLFKNYLRQDKKHKAGFKIDFIFINKPGEVFGRPVLEIDLIKEAKRQSLL